MANLLDSASIVLTPTAYDNGSMLSVKPNDGAGDFDFSRNSAATRVNAQGLVENVQILSGDLVSNGDFSQEGVQEVSNGSFSQEGAELVTNGDFATDSDWSLGTGWSIGNGKASCDGNQTSQTTLQSVYNLALGVGNLFKITFDISNYSSGQINAITLVGTGGPEIANINANGSYTAYSFGASTSDGKIQIIANSDFIGSIDNVSVKEVGQDWTLGTGWSIGEDKVVHSGTQSLIGQSNILTIGKTYKITFDLSGADGSNYARLLTSQYPNGGNYTSDGTISVYTITNIDDLYIYGVGDISITNISVKEVGQDWTLGTGWSIGDDKAIHSGIVAGNLTQNAFTSGKSYKVKWTQTSGEFVNVWGDGLSSLISSSDVNKDYTFYFNSVSGGNISFRTDRDGAEVTNISVIEITDDTNLPRINYEGFSYQDSLGSEEVTNGDFATDTDWTKVTGWTISGGKANSNTSAYRTLAQNIPIVLGKKYKVFYDVVSYTSGSVSMTIGADSGALRSAVGSYSEIIEYNTFYSSSGPRSGGSGFVGSIDNISVKEYLGQEVVPDSGCGSWLLEPQSTNLITDSQTFTGSLSQVSRVSNSTDINDPFGTNTAFKFTVLTSGADANTRITKSISVTEFSVSIYVNGLAGQKFEMFLARDSYSQIFSTQEVLSEGWQRIELNGTFSTASTTVIIGLEFGFTSNDSVAGQEYYLTGLQLEQQSYATSYIPTNGAASTRLQDIANNSGNATLINSTEGVLYAELAALADDGTNREISLNDGTANNSVAMLYHTVSNYIFFQVFKAGTRILNLSVNNVDKSILHKIAFKYKNSDYSVWIDGVELLTDSLADNIPANTLNKLSFDGSSGAYPFYGKAKALAVYKEALTDEQLTCLTTI